MSVSGCTGQPMGLAKASSGYPCLCYATSTIGPGSTFYTVFASTQVRPSSGVPLIVGPLTAKSLSAKNSHVGLGN